MFLLVSSVHKTILIPCRDAEYNFLFRSGTGYIYHVYLFVLLFNDRLSVLCFMVLNDK
jgi:hypothetical protein